MISLQLVRDIVLNLESVELTDNGSFVDEDTGRPYYVDQVKELRRQESTTIFVDFEHVSQNKPALAQSLQREYFRFDPYLRKAVFALVAKYDPMWIRKDNTGGEDDKRDFWVSWYGITSVKKCVSISVEYKCFLRGIVEISP